MSPDDATTIDLLLTGGTVVTMGPDRAVLEGGAVAIDGPRIVAVGPTAELERRYRARRTLDCRGGRSCPA